jgi:hypothetical protein
VRAPGAAVAALAVLLVAAPAVAQPPSGGGAPAAPRATAGPPHPDGLDCVACHVDKHRGVQRLYAGTGGRGAPPAPDRMFQVGVQCTACHSTPRSPEGAREIAGQTFVVTDQACVACHDARYGGLVERWRAGLTTMRETVAAKAAATRAALGAAEAGKKAQAARRLDDAEHNLRLVTLAHGAHNVFYAANLLARADAWLGEAATTLGKALPKKDDALVRGGYCGPLCHEPLGISPKETVLFRGRPLPHARHATELGATCTTCHSADAHKKLAATPATCRTCHHSPQNDRCESCHRDQTAFYRGTLPTAPAPIAPNVMAAAVACTNCHDFAKSKPRAAIAEACTSCHEPTYLPLLTEWTKGFAPEVKAAADAVAAAERAVAVARRAGRGSPEADARIREAREALALVRAGGVPHNPLAASALLARARAAADDAKTRAGVR